MQHVQLRLVGPITAYGGQTYVTSQTGTGSTFAMSVGPTFSPTVTVSGTTGNGLRLNMNANQNHLILAEAGTDKWVFSSNAGTLLITDAAGNTRISSTNAGAVTIPGTLGVTSDLAVNTNKFNVTASSGNTAIAGTLNVTGAAQATSLGVGAAVSSGKALVSGTTGDGLRVNMNANQNHFILAEAGTDKWVIFSNAGTLHISTAAGADILTSTSAGLLTAPGNLSVTGTLGVTGAATLSSTLDVTATVTGSSFSDSKGDVRTIPQNSKSAAYTTVLSDAGKHILHPSADTTARTFTIDSNANVAYPIGTAITFVNQNGAGTVTIAITTDTMRLAGSGTTGSRTLAANGIATALKITSTEWIISGTNLS